MKPNQTVLRETARMALGIALCAGIMFGVYALLGKLGGSVVAGGLYTSALTILNFFVMGMTVQAITNEVGKKERTDEEIENLSTQMKARMKTSYSMRTLAMLALVVVGIVVFKFDGLATVLPLAFPRAVLLILQITGRVNTSEGSDQT